MNDRLMKRWRTVTPASNGMEERCRCGMMSGEIDTLVVRRVWRDGGAGMRNCEYGQSNHNTTRKGFLPELFQLV